MNTTEARLCLLLHGVPGISDPTLARMLLHSGSAGALAVGGQSLWCELGLSAAAARNWTRPRAAALPLSTSMPSWPVWTGSARTSRRFVIPATRRCCEPSTTRRPALCAGRSRCCRGATWPWWAVAGQPGGTAGRAHSPATPRWRACMSPAAWPGYRRRGHQGALAAGGRSIAVVATGIDRVYPASHRGLATALEQAGCLVTEFPPGCRR